MISIAIAPTSTSHDKCEHNDTPNTNETDKTNSHNYSNDLIQQHTNLHEAFPLKNEFHIAGDIPTMRTQTPVPSFYSKKIIPNPLLNNQIQPINIPGTPTPHKKTITTPSHVCIAYKDKTNHYLNGKVPSLSSFNTNKLSISNSNFNINTSRNHYNTNNSYMKRKVPPQLELNEVVDNSDKKIIKITNTLKEEVVAKQQLKLLCESEEMVRCNTMGKMEGKGNVNNGNGGIGIVGINRDKIVRLKSSSLQRCSNHSGNSNNIVMMNKPGTPVVGSSSSNYQNYFFIQTNNNVNNNINNNNNNEAMLQYSHSTPPYENTIDYYNNNYSMHNINMNNTYSSFNSYNTANNDNSKTYIICNPITSSNVHPHLTQINSPVLNPNLIYNKTNRYYQYNDSLNHSNQIHSLPNLNQSCPININNSPTMMNKPVTVIDSYVKKTLKHINTKDTVKNKPDKKKKYINKQQSIDKHKHKDKPKTCLHIDIKGNSGVKSNSNKCNSNTQGGSAGDKKGIGSGGYYSGVVGKKKVENVFLKFHSQIYQQLTQDK